MAGFEGHRDRFQGDNDYAMKMEDYPAEFCDEVIEELQHFDVWVNGLRPTDRARRPEPKAKGSGAKGSGAKGSGAKGSGAKGKVKDGGKAKGKGKDKDNKGKAGIPSIAILRSMLPIAKGAQ